MSQPTHIAVPVQIFQQVARLLGELPHHQVAHVLQSLQACPGMTLKPNAKIGDVVNGPPEVSE
jgi:hypothetical protein